MLAGRYPSDEFAELRPRIVWDRATAAHRAARRAAAGRHQRRHDPRPRAVRRVPRRRRAGRAAGRRAGRGDGLRVAGRRHVRPRRDHAGGSRTSPTTGCWSRRRPGRPGRLPFWKGDASGRPAELGRAVGAFVRELGRAAPRRRPPRAAAAAGLDEWAADNLVTYLDEQREATGTLPDDRTIVVERFRDELGDWRVSSTRRSARQVHAPGRWRSARGCASGSASTSRPCTATTASSCGCPTRFDDGRRRPGRPGRCSSPRRSRTWSPTSRRLGAVRGTVPRVRGPRPAAAPPRRPDRRQPLWQQRQRAAQLLQVASQYASFPIVLETVRECLQDVFDVPALVELMRGIAAAQVGWSRSRPPSPRRSPGRCCSATSPVPVRGRLAARRAAGGGPVAGPRACWPSCSAGARGRAARPARPRGGPATEAELQRLAAGAAGPATPRTSPTCCGCSGRCPPTRSRPGASRRRRRGRRLAGRARSGRARGDPGAGRRRGALGRGRGRRAAARRARRAAAGRRARGVPRAGRRTRSATSCAVRPHPRPVHRRRLAARLGARRRGGRPMPLRRLVAAGRVVEGEFRPAGGGGHGEWCDAEVLRTLRRRSLARAAARGRAGPAVDLARFLPAWQGVGGGLRGAEGVLRAVEQLAGARRPGQRPGDAGAARAGRRLLPRPARRADRRRRGALARPRRRCPATTAGSRCTSPTPPR